MNIVFRHRGILPVVEYGGIERLIYWHMVELVKKGHKVSLIGHPKSQVEGKGITLIPERDKKHWYEQIPSNTDVVHLFYNENIPVDIPVVNTIGGNGKVGEHFTLNTVFVSKNHASNHGSETFIYNGIDLSEYPYPEGKRIRWDEFLFLAKASWKVKNVKQCTSSCKNLEKRLNIVGGSTIFPSKYIRGHGMLGGAKKLEVIRKCDALLFPVRWHEPFGLAIVEAMSQGLPVIGSQYGSLPELINPSVGITCESYNSFISALRGPQCFDSDKIRKYVEDNFSITTYTDKYLETFKRVISGESLNKEMPMWRLPYKAEDLLPF